jgi:hypothetical protein
VQQRRPSKLGMIPAEFRARAKANLGESIETSYRPFYSFDRYSLFAPFRKKNIQKRQHRKLMASVWTRSAKGVNSRV